MGAARRGACACGGRCGGSCGSTGEAAGPAVPCGSVGEGPAGGAARLFARPRGAGQPEGPHEAPCGVGLPVENYLVPRLGIRAAEPGPDPTRGALLYPGGWMAVPGDGNWLPAIVEAANRMALAPVTLLRPVRSSVDAPRRAPSPEGHLGSAPGPAGPAAVFAAPLVGAPGGFSTTIVAPFTDRVTLRYRTESCEVSFAFVCEWLADLAELRAVATRSTEAWGAVASVDDTLTEVWDGYFDRMRGDREGYRALLACYNLPKERAEWELHKDEFPYGFLFWHTDWQAPFEVHVHVCGLVRSFWIDIAELGDCEGLASFVDRALAGRSVRSAAWGLRADVDCRLSLSYPNPVESAFPALGTACTMSGPTAVDCAEGMTRDCDGLAWHEVRQIVWNEGSDCWSSSASGCTRVGAGCGAFLSTARSLIRAQPGRLCWDGLVCDRILTAARLARDFARRAALLAPELAEAAAKAGKRFGRYALAYLVYHGSMLIHELGHVYLGACHCHWNCCLDQAGGAWWLEVKARLGLPWYDEAPSPSGEDFPGTPVAGNDARSCSSSGGSIDVGFSFSQLGKPGGSVAWVLGGCTTGSLC